VLASVAVATETAKRGGIIGFLSGIYILRSRDQAVHPAGRLAGFTDAILAIAATLTVLNLSTSVDRPGNRLGHQIGSQKAVLFATALGFMWITGSWVLSHRALRQLRGADHYMTLLVIARSLVITLIPFATSLLARGVGHSDFWVGVEAVAVVILTEQLLAMAGTDYAHRRGLTVTPSTPAARHFAVGMWAFWIAVTIAACVTAPWLDGVALALIIVVRISSLLPIASDRRGLYGDLGRNTDA